MPFELSELSQETLNRLLQKSRSETAIQIIARDIECKPRNEQEDAWRLRVQHDFYPKPHSERFQLDDSDAEINPEDIKVYNATLSEYISKIETQSIASWQAVYQEWLTRFDFDIAIDIHKIISNKNEDWEFEIFYVLDIQLQGISADMQFVNHYLNDKAHCGYTLPVILANADCWSELANVFESGLDANVVSNNDNSTALHVAIQKNQRDYVELCLQYIDPNVGSLHQQTAFELAFTTDMNSPLISLLMERNADINHCDNEGNTLLLRYARRQHWVAVNRLIELGADVNVVANDGVCYENLRPKRTGLGLFDNSTQPAAPAVNANTDIKTRPAP